MINPSASARPPLSAVRAWAFVGINLLATPGLGSYWGGRRMAGRGQMLFSVIGFFLIVGWIFKFSYNVSMAEIDGNDAATVPAWWWEGGLLAFGIGWVWSLISSVGMVMESFQAAKTRPPAPPKLSTVTKPVPPKL